MCATPVAATDEALAAPDIGISDIFTTPLGIIDWPDSDTLNAELLQVIAVLRRTAAGVDRSNVGGWHSPSDFILREDPPLEVLRRRIRHVMIDFTRRYMTPGRYQFAVEGWANVLGVGHYNGPHNHPNATWSGVYYLTGIEAGASTPDGGTSLAGKIEFFDPRPAAGMRYGAENALQRRCLFTPRAGCMIVFPAWLQHMVHPHAGPHERHSIAFNVTVT